MNIELSRRRVNGLPQHIIDSEQGYELLDDEDFYHPRLNVSIDKLKKTICENCGDGMTLEFGRHGSIKLVCNSCDSKKHACPLCNKMYVNQKNVISHYRSKHDDITSCPICSETLKSAIGDRIEHLSCHISSDMFSSTDAVFDHSTYSSFNINSFPDQNQNRFEIYNEGEEQVTYENINSGFNTVTVDDGGGDDGYVGYSPADHLTETEISEHLGTLSDEEEEEDECEFVEVIDKRMHDHISGLESEFFHFEDDTESYDLVIEPVKEKESDEFGLFYNLPNLNLAKFSRKANLSGPILQELIEDMGSVYESKVDFFSSETLMKKVHTLAKEEGFEYTERKCSNGHLVCLIPIEEGLKMLFSKTEFLMEFHAREWEIGENDPYMHYRQGEKFIREAKRARSDGCHYISLLANRDDFPPYLTTVYPIKGYYWSVGNLDYPECERHVVCFAFGLQCPECRRTVDENFVENVNRLSDKPFLIYHSLIEKYVRFKLEFDAEIDDSPEVAKMTMSKSHTGRLFCSQCGQHESLRLDPFSYHKCKSKTLIETETLYHVCENIMSNSKSGDGSITRVSKIEDRSGRSFTTYEFNKRLGHNVKVMKRPTSLFKLNDYTKRHLVTPNGPFHAIIKGYILHVKDGLAAILTPDQKRQIQDRWLLLEFPKGTKKPSELWGIGGSNFDAILSVLYGLPLVIGKVVPDRLFFAIEMNFSCVVKLLTPGFSRNVLRVEKSKFTKTIVVIGYYLNIDYPTTHQAYHIWDRAVPPNDNHRAPPNQRDSTPLPLPPKGPILKDVGDEERVTGLGPTRCWNEKKFEMMHRRFKKKMRKCFLRNPCVYLIREYVADETLAIMYPDRKWSRYNPLIRYTLLKNCVLEEDDKIRMMAHLGIGEWNVEDVDFLRVKELNVRTKIFRRQHRIVVSNDCGIVQNMILVKWNGGNGWEFSSLLIIIELYGTRTMKIHEVENVKGKPIMVGNVLKSVIM